MVNLSSCGQMLCAFENPRPNRVSLEFETALRRHGKKLEKEKEMRFTLLVGLFLCLLYSATAAKKSNDPQECEGTVT